RIYVKRSPIAAAALSRHVVSLRQPSRARYDRPLGRVCRRRGGHASNAEGALPIGITTNLTLACTIFLAPLIAEYEEPPPNYIDYDSANKAEQAPFKNEGGKQKSILKRKLAEKNDTISELETEVDELEAKLERLEAILHSVSIGAVDSTSSVDESNKIIEDEATA